jgi:V/A-type H+-transporting ATPase subunit E
MPVTVEDKMELFSKILFERIEEDWSEKRNEIERTMELKLEEEKREFEKKKKAIIEDRESKSQAKRKMILSKVQSDSDQQIMKKKEALLKQMTEDLKNWSRAFINKDSYNDFLQKSINETFNVIKGKNLVLSLTERDANVRGSFIRQEVNKYGAGRVVELAVSNEDIIGGFMAEDKDSGILADFTMKSLIDEGRDLMGELLYEKLDEVLKS